MNTCTYIPKGGWNGPCGRKVVPGTNRCDLHQPKDDGPAKPLGDSSIVRGHQEAVKWFEAGE